MRQAGRPSPRFRRPAVAPAEPEISPRENLSLTTAAFWQAAYQGWFTTALEQTKAVFTLSSAGVGLSLTLLFSAKVQPMDSWAPVWLLVAATLFVVAACLSVAVFQVNKKVLRKLAKNEDFAEEEAFVGRLQLAATLGFGAGLVFLILSGISQVWL
jgi:hypothetical protein